MVSTGTGLTAASPPSQDFAIGSHRCGEKGGLHRCARERAGGHGAEEPSAAG